MLLSNKKFIISLIVLTVLSGLVFKRTNPASVSEDSLRDYSINLNKNLPIVISPEITLVKTKIGNVSPLLFSLDFYYSYSHNKNDLSNYQNLSEEMVVITCKDPMTKDLIDKGALLRHQFVTLDKELLPLVGVSKEVCNKKFPNEINNTKTVTKDNK